MEARFDASARDRLVTFFGSSIPNVTAENVMDTHLRGFFSDDEFVAWFHACVDEEDRWDMVRYMDALQSGNSEMIYVDEMGTLCRQVVSVQDGVETIESTERIESPRT